MKKKFKCIIAIIFICSVFCSGCQASVFYERAVGFDEINAIELFYNKYTKKAFASSYMWDGDESKMEITIPDTCNGCKVTDLGGYYGSGAICPFVVIIPEIYRDKEAVYYYMTLPAESNEENTEKITFKVNIGKNLKKLERISKDIYLGYGDKETNTVEQFYIIDFYYVCSEENETFYSKDGVLYLKSNDEKAQFRVGGDQ